MELAFDAIRGHKSAHSFATGPVIADPESRTALVRHKITKYQVKALFNMCYTFQFDFRISFKVHMKRFFTVVFHFIIVHINIKESYIT